MGALFMAGVVPGSAPAFSLGGFTYWRRARTSSIIPRLPKATWGERWEPSGLGLGPVPDRHDGRHLQRHVHAHRSGRHEAGVRLHRGRVIYKAMGLKDVPRCCSTRRTMCAMLLYIITNAVLFSFIMTNENIPQALADWMLGNGLGMITFLLAVNVILLLAGNVMEPSSIVLIFAPILFPVAMKLGTDPVHFGIIMVVNMEVGMPPARGPEPVMRGLGHYQDGHHRAHRRRRPWDGHAGLPGGGHHWPGLSLWVPRMLGMM